MRYFFVCESQKRAQARLFMSCGFVSGALSFVLSLFAGGEIAGWNFFFDLCSCALLFCGSRLWDSQKLKTPSRWFAAAFVVRFILLVLNPKGLFSFLAFVPYSACLLIGQISLLEAYEAFLARFCAVRESRAVLRSKNALARSEVSFWIAVFLSYLSDLLLFPAIVLFLWSAGVRAWVSYLLFHSPALTFSFPLENKRVRAQ